MTLGSGSSSSGSQKLGSGSSEDTLIGAELETEAETEAGADGMDGGAEMDWETIIRAASPGSCTTASPKATAAADKATAKMRSEGDMAIKEWNREGRGE